MTISEIEYLIQLLRANGVSRFKSDKVEIRFTQNEINTQKPSIAPSVIEGPPLQAIPPVNEEIIHHINEVKDLLRLGPNDLVERMWPDQSPMAEEG